MHCQATPLYPLYRVSAVRQSNYNKSKTLDHVWPGTNAELEITKRAKSNCSKGSERENHGAITNFGK